MQVVCEEIFTNRISRSLFHTRLVDFFTRFCFWFRFVLLAFLTFFTLFPRFLFSFFNCFFDFWGWLDNFGDFVESL